MTESKYSSGAPVCACGKPIIQRSGPGRPRKHCGPACAERAVVRTRETDGHVRQYVRVSVRSFECIQCHAKFDSPRAKKYCGPYCKERAKHLKRRPNASARGPLAPILERPCANCDKVFKPRVGRYGTYCTRECAFERLAIIRRLAAGAGPGQQCFVYFKVCAHCGITWTARHKATPTCSDECSKGLASARARAWGASKCDKGSRACRCCGKDFTPGYGDKRSVYCGLTCAVRQCRRQGDKTARKRARKYGVHYEPVNKLKVFNRDGWKCQICGRQTPRRRMGTFAANAPELDHRVPISRGGAHSYANVQCSCRECNGAKSNLRAIGQMPLFAA